MAAGRYVPPYKRKVARDTRPTIIWPGKKRGLTKEQLARLTTQECLDYRSLACSPEGSCNEFRPARYQPGQLRQAIYDRSIFERYTPRYWCNTGRKESHNKVCVVVESLDGEQVLMVQSYGGNWSFPKGSLEEGEVPIKAALRELEEETSIKSRERDLITAVSDIAPEQASLVFNLKISPRTRLDLASLDWEISAIAWINKVDLSKIKLNRYSYELAQALTRGVLRFEEREA